MIPWHQSRMTRDIAWNVVKATMLLQTVSTRMQLYVVISHRFGRKSKWCWYMLKRPVWKSNPGVVHSSYECLTLGQLNKRCLLPKINEIKFFLAASNFDNLLFMNPGWIMQYWIQKLLLKGVKYIIRIDQTRSVMGFVNMWKMSTLSMFVMKFNDVEVLWGVLYLDT